MQSTMSTIMRFFSCRSAVDAVPPAGPAPPRPRATTVGVVRPTATASYGSAPPRGPPLPSHAFAGASTSLHRASIPRPYMQPRVPLGFQAGIFGAGAFSSHTGGYGQGDHFYDDDLEGTTDQEILGSSQLGGAPPPQTQEQPPVTPVPEGRASHAVPPDRLTYSQGHVRAQGRRDKGKRARQ